MSELHPDPIKRWMHRRFMAYLALLGGLAFPALLLATESSVLADVAWPAYAFFGSIVGAYVGTAAWETISITRNK